ncbi:MAG: RluA family pseudouridine synthase [Lentisphaeria bacterium]|nr:RluA family pseudouridine synthase [Lentisphaeria bacterium]
MALTSADQKEKRGGNSSRQEEYSGEKRIIETKILPENSGKRLDNYLADRFTYRSRTQWQEAVVAGEILVNGRKVRSSRILHAGDMLSFVPDESTLEEPQVDTSYKLLLERKEFIAVSKPPSIPVHPSGRFFNNTLLKVVEKDLGKVWLVNRLDRETSGVTLFARDPENAKKLSRLFEERKVQKKYIAIVHGRFPQVPFTVSGVLTQDEKSPVHKKRRFLPDEKTLSLLSSIPSFTGKMHYPPLRKDKEREEAVTSFVPVKCTEKMSIVEVIPSTGRLHQIRATLYSLGFPMAGDKLYGLDDTLFIRYTGDLLTAEDQEKLILSHQALHAATLSFVFPGEKEMISINAPLPEEFSNLYHKIMSAIL